MFITRIPSHCHANFTESKTKARRRENQLLKFRLCIPVSEFYLRDVINFIYQVGGRPSVRLAPLHLLPSAPRFPCVPAPPLPPARGFHALWLFDLSLIVAEAHVTGRPQWRQTGGDWRGGREDAGAELSTFLFRCSN